jgi:hypothetical protein
MLLSVNTIPMAELKTKKNEKNVEDFLNSLDDKKKQDSFIILNLMREISGEEPKMWGDSIVGFGEYSYKYKSGKEGTWFKIGFSPRKQNFTLYLMSGFKGKEDILARIGKYKTGKGCFYINKTEDVDLDVLKELISESHEFISDPKNTIYGS